MKLNDRETATVLAALRTWQQHIAGNAQINRLHPAPTDRDVYEISTGQGELNPLSFQEIDNLCERINFDSEEVCENCVAFGAAQCAEHCDEATAYAAGLVTPTETAADAMHLSGIAPDR